MTSNNILIMQNTRKYLSYFLIWPTSNRPSSQINWNAFFIKYFTSFVITILVMFGCIAHLFHSIFKNHGFNWDTDIGMLAGCIGCHCFNYQFVSHIKGTIRAYEALSDMEKFGEPTNFNADNKKLNRYALIHFIYILFVGVAFSMAPLLELSKCRKLNAQLNLAEPCGFIVMIWIPFGIDVNAFPLKQIIIVLEVYSTFFVYCLSSIISFTIVESFEHIIIRFNHLNELIKSALTDDLSPSERREKFNNCVRYHVVIMDWAAELDHSFKDCMFIHIVLTSSILGFLSYRITQSFSSSVCALLTGWLLSMIAVCNVGERIIAASLSVGDNIFTFNWHTLDIPLQKDLIMVVRRSQKPIYLHGGRLTYMTFATIGIVLKTSYSYFALMSNSK